MGVKSRASIGDTDGDMPLNSMSHLLLGYLESQAQIQGGLNPLAMIKGGTCPERRRMFPPVRLGAVVAPGSDIITEPVKEW